MENTKEQVEEEQGGFRSGRGCIYQIFVLKQLVEKKREGIACCIHGPGEGVSLQRSTVGSAT